MRLIDADALIPIMKYTTTDNEIGVFPIRIGFNAIKGVIDDAPTIDAVEVVRCKDCKYKRLYDEGDTKYYYCALEDRPNRNWSVDDTDYCSWGEKSEVEE